MFPSFHPLNSSVCSCGLNCSCFSCPDLPNIFPQVHEAATAAAGANAPKGKKQKKLPRYENTWSKEELHKLEEGLKKYSFDVTKVQGHVGSRKAYVTPLQSDEISDRERN
jgi:hypothetical protein